MPSSLMGIIFFPTSGAAKPEHMYRYLHVTLLQAGTDLCFNIHVPFNSKHVSRDSPDTQP